jgi:hypothetical protein
LIPIKSFVGALLQPGAAGDQKKQQQLNFDQLSDFFGHDLRRQ